MVEQERRLLILFFFFQAEDGIRDYKVTGVQTCALPISGALLGGRMKIRILLIDDFPLIREGFAAALEADPGLTIVGQADNGEDGLRLEIGRASCRERV